MPAHHAHATATGQQQVVIVKFVFLGTGTSHGIPMIGCDCPVCTSADPRDKRSRPSVLVQWNNVNVLVDTAPELRLQCLANDVTHIEAVLFTHHHADHVTGLDDLRRFNWIQRTALPCYGSALTLRKLQEMFSYAFRQDDKYPSAKPDLALHPVDGPFEIGGREVVPIPLLHGRMPVLGFRFGPVAYCTDCSFIPPESMALLEGLDTLVLDALRRRPHPTHFNLEQAIEWAQQIGARQTYFTHIAHELGHQSTNEELPPNMHLAHDSLVLNFPA
jgi:phosphoribosyl 1,2-cyclic phosphate phosphodiesterase